MLSPAPSYSGLRIGLAPPEIHAGGAGSGGGVIAASTSVRPMLDRAARGAT